MRLKLAQYGIAHAHASGKADAMLRNPYVDFCGIFEPDEQVLMKQGKASVYKDIHWFKSKQEMLEDDSIVGIAVECRMFDSLAFTREAIEHGKHVWLDKPAGVDLDEFHSILTLAKEKKLLVQQGYMFRYNLGFQFIFDMLNNGKLGDVFFMRGRMSNNAPTWYRESMGQYQGGVLYELVCHLMDIMIAILGRPEKVTSFLRNDMGVTPEFSDNTLAVFEYDGAMAVLESAAMEVSPFPSRRFEIYGTKGSVILEPLEPPRIRLCLDEDYNKYTKGWQMVDVVDSRKRYDGEITAFVADIRGEKQPDRSLYHELIVQETVIRASRGIERALLSDMKV